MILPRFDAIRDACRAVTERARFVRVRTERVPAYARSLPLDTIIRPVYDTVYHFLGAPEDTAAYILTLDTVNFGSGYFPHMQKRPGLSGYFTVASHLKDHFDTHGPLSAQALTDLDVQACATLFGQDLQDGVRKELIERFTQALNDLGVYLLEHHGGSFTALIEAAQGSAERLAGLLAHMPFFQDVAVYDGFDVPLYKRAQITSSDLSLAFAGEGLGAFHDLDRLTIFADNLVPHVLRVDGLLEYDRELLERITRGELIPAGSPEEVEIRAVALHTVELMTHVLRGDGHPVTAQGLDVLLWNRGGEEIYKLEPRHRTRTVYY